MRQLVHSLFGDNNLVSFHLRAREILLKSEKSTKVLPKIVRKIFLLVFTTLKIHLNSKIDQFLAENSKTYS